MVQKKNTGGNAIKSQAEERRDQKWASNWERPNGPKTSSGICESGRIGSNTSQHTFSHGSAGAVVPTCSSKVVLPISSSASRKKGLQLDMFRPRGHGGTTWGLPTRRASAVLTQPPLHGNKGPKSNASLRLNPVQNEQRAMFANRTLAQTERAAWPVAPHFPVQYPTSTFPQTGVNKRKKQHRTSDATKKNDERGTKRV